MVETETSPSEYRPSRFGALASSVPPETGTRPSHHFVASRHYTRSRGISSVQLPVAHGRPAFPRLEIEIADKGILRAPQARDRFSRCLQIAAPKLPGECRRCAGGERIVPGRCCKSPPPTKRNLPIDVIQPIGTVIVLNGTQPSRRSPRRADTDRFRAGGARSVRLSDRPIAASGRSVTCAVFPAVVVNREGETTVAAIDRQG